MGARLEAILIGLGERKVLAMIRAAADAGAVKLTDAERRLVRGRR